MALTKIQSLGITDGTIVNADINASAAIAGTKLTGVGKVLQVVSTTKTSTFSTATTGSFVEVTGLNVNITPSSASSKIFISGIVAVGHSTTTAGLYLKVQRDSTDIGIGDASSSSIRSMAGTDVREYQTRQLSINFLDSPNTTSAINYKVLIQSPNATSHINNDGEADGTNHTQPISTITVMEIAA